MAYSIYDLGYSRSFVDQLQASTEAARKRAEANPPKPITIAGQTIQQPPTNMSFNFDQMAQNRERQYQKLRSELINGNTEAVLNDLARRGGPNKEGKQGPIRRRIEREGRQDLNRFNSEQFAEGLKAKEGVEKGNARIDRNNRNIKSMGELQHLAKRNGRLTSSQMSEARGLGLLPQANMDFSIGQAQPQTEAGQVDEGRANLRKGGSLRERVRDGY